MFVLDLFNNDHERRLAEGAVDQLEQRRIDDLAMRMDDLVARAKTADTPKAKSALMKEFQKCKVERDSYYKIHNETMGYGSLGEGQVKQEMHKAAERMSLEQFIDRYGDEEWVREFWNNVNGPVDEGGIPGNVPVEKIPGKEDLLKGQGRSYYESQKKNSEQVAEEEQQLAIASKYAGDGQFQITVNNKHKYIVTVAGFEINPLDTGILDSFYLTDAQTGKTKHVASTNSPLEDAIYEHLWHNQRPALKQIYAEDMAFYKKHGWNNGRPDRLEGLPLTGWNATPATDFIGGYKAMKRVTGQELDEKKLGQLRPTLGTARDMGKSVRKFRTARGLDEDQGLHAGDPVVVTGSNEFAGKTGEIHELSPSGKFAIVDLYNHGRHSMHLSDIKYNDYADQEEEDDWYDEGLNEFAPSSERDDNGDNIPNQLLKLANRWWNATDDQPRITNILRSLGWSIHQVESEDDAVQLMHDDGTVYFISADDFDPDVFEGWSDAIVAQRTGQPRTPYSVYIKGKKWKDFENEDHAEAVANKLRAKFKAEGRDPGVITIAPTDYDKDIKESNDRIDPILIKALNNMPDGLNSHGEVLNACYDAYAMELGKMRMKSEYGTTNVYVPKLMDLYKQKHGLTFNEAYTPSPAKPFRNPPGFNKQGTGPGNRLAQQTRAELAKKKEINEADKDVESTIRTLMAPAYVDGSGGNFSYELERKAPTMDALRTKYHDDLNAILTQTSPRELAQAAKELKALRWNPQEMEETAKKGLYYNVNKRKAAGTSRSKNNPKAPTAQAWKDAAKTAKTESVKEAQTDYQKRRQRERDVDAGRPVKPVPKNPQTDYAKKRAKEKRDLELFGEDSTSSNEAVEQAVLRRIMVAHLDLLKQFGPQKVMQAIEEVAYNVGDVDEIGTSDVSAYVNQVQQILGAE